MRATLLPEVKYGPESSYAEGPEGAILRYSDSHEKAERDCSADSSQIRWNRITLYPWMQSSRLGLVSLRLNCEGIVAMLHRATATLAMRTCNGLMVNTGICTLIDSKPRSSIDAKEGVRSELQSALQ